MTPPLSTTADEYDDLSRRYALAGEHRLAQLAAWSADVHRLEELLWHSGLAESPDPATELNLIAETVAASIEAAAADLDDTASVGRALSAAREALVTTFDPSLHDALRACFSALDDLDHLDRATTHVVDPGQRTASRLSGLTPDGLVAELRTAAADCRVMADVLEAGDEPEAAARMGRQAEAAAFEAYLVMSAIRAGDDALATVDLRWDLVAGQDPSVDRLVSVVGSAEQDALRHTLEDALDGTRSEPSAGAEIRALGLCQGLK